MSDQWVQIGGVSEFLDRPVFSLGSVDATVGMILIATVVLIGTLAAAWTVKRLTIRHFERHEAGDDVAVGTLAKILAAVVFLVGLDIVLHIFGLRLTSLFAAGGIFALGAGFAVKNTLENYISGIILRLDQTIRQGDVVELEGSLWRSEKQESRVILEEFTVRSIVYSVSLWIEDVSRVKQSKSDLNETIWSELEAAGVSLA